MKKVILLLFATLLLTSCSASKQAPPNTPSDVQDPPAETADAEAQAPVYTPEDDAAAASYLIQAYGLDHLADPQEKPKVIFDCDMTFLGDDAMAMCILVEADTLGMIDLLGITVTGGNSCVAAETNAVLKQLECIGRSDIPVYMGTDEPINGFRDLSAQEEIVGSIQHWGLLYRLDDYVAPSAYHDLGAFYERAWGYSEAVPQDMSSVEFMTESVRRFPSKVTILSTGAPTNIALACMEDPSFASQTAGIIYIGTILHDSGTYTPYADFNCFYDPDAFSICLKSAFPKQIVIPHDVIGDAVLDKAVFDLLNAKTKTMASLLWLDHQYSLYRRTPTRKDSCSDAVASVIFLIPSVILESEEHDVTVHTDTADAHYGSIDIYEAAEEHADASRARFITKLDTALYWDFVTDLLSHSQEKTPYTYAEFAAQNGTP